MFQLTRYTLDPFDDTAAAGSSGVTKLHLAAAVLDPRAKDMVRIPLHIKRKAYCTVERIWEQLIAEKLDKEFAVAEDSGSDEDTASGGGADKGSWNSCRSLEEEHLRRSVAAWRGRDGHGCKFMCSSAIQHDLPPAVVNNLFRAVSRVWCLL